MSKGEFCNPGELQEVDIDPDAPIVPVANVSKGTLEVHQNDAQGSAMPVPSIGGSAWGGPGQKRMSTLDTNMAPKPNFFKRLSTNKSQDPGGSRRESRLSVAVNETISRMSSRMSVISAAGMGALQKLFGDEEAFEKSISKKRTTMRQTQKVVQLGMEDIEEIEHPHHDDSCDLADQVMAHMQGLQHQQTKRIFPMANKRWPICDRVFMFLEEPSSSPGAHYYALSMMGLIFSSVVLSLILSSYPDQEHNVIYVDMSFDTIFLMEVLMRLCTCPKIVHFFRNFNNIVDLVAAAPLLIRLFLGFQRAPKGSALELVMLHRPILRLMKTTRNFSGFQLLVRSLVVSCRALPVPLFMLLLMVMSFSSLIYWCEPRTSIRSMPHAMWFAIVTISTVGYGDTLPTTTFGQMLTVTFILFGVLYMAMPISIVGRNFTTCWNERDKILLMKKVRTRLASLGYSSDDVLAAFEAFDTNGKGEVGIEDFKRMAKELQLGTTEERVIELFQLFDSDGSGAIAFAEFCAVIFPNTVISYNKFRRNSLQHKREAVSQAGNRSHEFRKSRTVDFEKPSGRNSQKATLKKQNTADKGSLFGSSKAAHQSNARKSLNLGRQSVAGGRKSIIQSLHTSLTPDDFALSHDDSDDSDEEEIDMIDDQMGKPPENTPNLSCTGSHDVETHTPNAVMEHGSHGHGPTHPRSHHDSHGHGQGHPGSRRGSGVPTKKHFVVPHGHGDKGGGMFGARKHHAPVAGDTHKHGHGHHHTHGIGHGIAASPSTSKRPSGIATHGYHGHGHHDSPPLRNEMPSRIGKWLDARDKEMEDMHVRVDALMALMEQRGLLKTGQENTGTGTSPLQHLMHHSMDHHDHHHHDHHDRSSVTSEEWNGTSSIDSEAFFGSGPSPSNINPSHSGHSARSLGKGSMSLGSLPEATEVCPDDLPIPSGHGPRVTA